jgi:stalled ribosome rescue protein Dom34
MNAYFEKGDVVSRRLNRLTEKLNEVKDTIVKRKSLFLLLRNKTVAGKNPANRRRVTNRVIKGTKGTK